MSPPCEALYTDAIALEVGKQYYSLLGSTRLFAFLYKLFFYLIFFVFEQFLITKKDAVKDTGQQ